MRMRKKKNLDVRFAACADVMAFEPKEKRGKWRALFGNDNPIHLEIGCGKGRFAIGMAEQHPDVNFIAVEREEGALIMAAERCQQQPLPNLRFVSFDAAELREVFAPGEVDRIYLNFSDPWPPNRQRKRRLTWRAYLEVYDEILRQHIFHITGIKNCVLDIIDLCIHLCVFNSFRHVFDTDHLTGLA